jgi:dihydrofolate synthase/folylpolyglutamate synthase
MGYRETIDYHYGLQKHGIKLGLKTPRTLLSMFGNPQDSFKSVHISGTNGKGSTAAMLSAVLKSAGFKVGLFTSPHIASFTERIRIDGGEISEGEVIALAEEVRGKAGGLNPTFFEVVTAMGFLHFKIKGVDWAVVETGMGGRLDATNVIRPAAAVITSIALDHREFLGESIGEIAREKAGIIKGGVPVVTAPQDPAAMDMIEVAAGERGSPLYAAGRDFSFMIKTEEPFQIRFDYQSGALRLPDIVLPLSGAYQALNASLAIKAFELVSGDARSARGIIRDGLSSLKWPGRLELVAENPPVVIDGAHNPAAAEALASALKAGLLKGGRKMVLVMGVMADKDLEGVMRPLLPLASEVIFTAPDYGRAAAPQELARCAGALGFKSKTAPSVKEAMRMARAFNSLVLVTGSFYTIGEAKEALGGTGSLARLREWA